MAQNKDSTNLIERSKILATISTTFITILIALVSIAYNIDITRFSQVKGTIFFAGVLGLITLFTSLIPLGWKWDLDKNESAFNVVILISAISLAGAVLCVVLSLHGLMFT